MDSRTPCPRAWLLVLLVLTLATFCGCDSNYAPPEPANLAQPASVPDLTLVLPAKLNSEMGVWEQVAMMEAGRDKVLLSVERPEPGEPASRQAELIREAASEGAAAIIVVTGTDEVSTLVPALQAVHEQGIPVVLLGREVKVPGTKFAIVHAASREETAQKLVKQTTEVAGQRTPPVEGPALIVVTPEEPESIARAEAIEKALQDAGISLRGRLEIPRATQRKYERVEAAFKETPVPAIVFGTDESSTLAAAEYRDSLEIPKRFLLSGYAESDRALGLPRYGMIAGLVDLNQTEPAREAIELARKLAQGEEAPASIVTETPVLVSKGEEVRGFFPSNMGPMSPGSSGAMRTLPTKTGRPLGSVEESSESNAGAGSEPGPN